MQWFGSLNPLFRTLSSEPPSCDAAIRIEPHVPAWVRGSLNEDLLQAATSSSVTALESTLSFVKAAPRVGAALRGPVVLQIVHVRDVSQPTFRPTGATDNFVPASSAKRTLSFELTDGFRHCGAFESVFLEGLQEAALYPGVKLLVTDCPIVAGRLALRPSNCLVLGGHVEHLHSAWKAKIGLDARSAVSERRDEALRSKAGGPPSFAAFRPQAQLAADRTAKGIKNGTVAGKKVGSSEGAGAAEEDKPAPIERAVPAPGVVLPAFQRPRGAPAGTATEIQKPVPPSTTGPSGPTRPPPGPAYPCPLVDTFASAKRHAHASKRAAAAGGGRRVPSARRVVGCRILAVELVAAPRPDLDPEPCLCVTAADGAGAKEALAASAALRAQLLGIGTGGVAGAAPGGGQGGGGGGRGGGSTSSGNGRKPAAGAPGKGQSSTLSELLRRPGGEAALGRRLSSLQGRLAGKGGLRIGAEVDFRVGPFAALLGIHAPPPE